MVSLLQAFSVRERRFRQSSLGVRSKSVSCVPFLHVLHPVACECKTRDGALARLGSPYTLLFNAC